MKTNPRIPLVLGTRPGPLPVEGFDYDARRLRVIARVVLALSTRAMTAAELALMVIPNTFASVTERDGILRELVAAGVIRSWTDPELTRASHSRAGDLYSLKAAVVPHSVMPRPAEPGDEGHENGPGRAG